MTSMPASRSARAMILAPRSWPSRPGLATTRRIFFCEEDMGSADHHGHLHERMDRAVQRVRARPGEHVAEAAPRLGPGAESGRPVFDGDIVVEHAGPLPRDAAPRANREPLDAEVVVT